MMPSVTQLLIVLAIVVLIFGFKKFPSIASDLASGIKNFKAGMKDGGDASQAKTEAPDQVKSEAAEIDTAKKDETVKS